MKKLNKTKLIPLLVTPLLVITMWAPKMSRAAQSTVNLGTTSTFAVLAGSAITNTGTTTINGEVGGHVGVFPGTAFTGRNSTTVSGSVHLADTVASKAKGDLEMAYKDAEGRTPVTTIPTELGGTTLKPGVYDSADGTFQITGTLTLDAQGDPDSVFVFKAASTLITASSSKVNLINSARFCRTFWKVGSSATLGTNSHFIGHIFALTSITANTGATVQGQLLARNGAVTLDNNTITNGPCETTSHSIPVENEVTPAVTGEEVVTPAVTNVKVVTPAVTNVKVVTPAVTNVKVVTTTVTGGKLPKTSTHLYELLLIGAALTLVGILGWRSRKRYE